MRNFWIVSGLIVVNKSTWASSDMMIRKNVIHARNLATSSQCIRTEYCFLPFDIKATCDFRRNKCRYKNDVDIWCIANDCHMIFLWDCKYRTSASILRLLKIGFCVHGVVDISTERFLVKYIIEKLRSLHSLWNSSEFHSSITVMGPLP